MDGEYNKKNKITSYLKSEHDVNTIIEESKESDASNNNGRKRGSSLKNNSERELL